MLVTISPPARIGGTVSAPPSKSMAHRAVLCSALAKGTSHIENLEFSKDISATLAAAGQLCARVESGPADVLVEGLGHFRPVFGPVDCCESGSTLRFLIPIASLTGQAVSFTGRGRLMERPQKPYLDLFDEKGISYTYNPKKNGYVSEINGVSEFDYGKQSGWMYSVNGEYPEIGCGAYELKAGDTIRWRYTLDLGKDLGVTIPNTDKPSGGGGAPETTPETRTEPKSDETNTVSAVPSFYDVAKNAWYYNPVTAIAQKGLMTGTAANIFEPNKATTRAELVAILYRMEGSPAAYAASTFSDVAPNAWYAAPITWAENAKVVAGLDRTHFAPDNALTREQVAAILYNYAKAKGLDITLGGMAVREYADYDSISSYALPSVAWAVNTGIISGKSGYVLDPQDAATRAEIAAMLERFIAFYKIS